jgi:hypothetical protein
MTRVLTPLKLIPFCFVGPLFMTGEGGSDPIQDMHEGEKPGRSHFLKQKQEINDIPHHGRWLH